MTLILSESTIAWMMEMQGVLDENIRNQKGIGKKTWKESFNFNKKHKIALEVECAEFVNECHDVWKYWKDKPVDRERILDEAIDVIHFLMLTFNKWDRTPGGVYELQLIGSAETTPLQYLQAILKNYADGMTLKSVLFMLDHYGFTEQDIIEQYKRKNAINFERLETGY